MDWKNRLDKKIKIDPLFIDEYKKIMGTDFDDFMDYSTRPLNKAIRVNTLKISIKSLKERFSQEWILESVPWCKEGFWIKNKNNTRTDLGNLLEHALGYYYVQDPASMIPPVILNPKPGEKVLDMCAAPGSKTTQIASYLQNKGIIIANDSSPERLKSLEINCRRMGINNYLITRLQAQHLDRLLKDGVSFDKILLDAPCSGSGTIRKSFKVLLQYSKNFVKNTASKQKKMIETAYRLLKPGGVLVYSTCTLEPEEDEETISHLIEKNPDAKVLPIEIQLKRRKPFLEWEGKKYKTDVKKCLRIYPQDNNTEGFFVAKIQKPE